MACCFGLCNRICWLTASTSASANMAEMPEPQTISRDRREGNQRSFLDLDKLVKEWAWTKYDTQPSRKQKALRLKEQRKNQSYIGVTINWSDCHFTDTTTWSRIAEDDQKSGSPSGRDAAESGALRAAATEGSDVSVLFQTEFANNTKSEQVYTMRVEKNTRSTCTAELESGVTRGYDMGVSLKLPEEILEMNAGYHREVTLTSISGQSFEEEVSWSAESEIRVDANTKACARLLVRERRQAGDFQVTTTIRGYVKVTFTNLRDNNSFLMEAAGDIGYIVQKYLDKECRLGRTYPYVTVDDAGVVTIVTKGKCKFRYGVKQEVKVDQMPL